MKYRAIGTSGITCSEISLGTWAFNARVYGTVDASDATRTVHAALDAGITLFDTAPLYGTPEQDGISEIILGEALKDRRKDILISTKFGRKPSDGARPYFNKAYLLKSVEESLQRLNIDVIDLLFFHSPFGADEIEDDVWEGLDVLKQAGKIRLVGHSISKFQDTQHMARTWATERKIDVIQVVTSLLNRESAQLITDLGQQGIGVVGRECLANGFLTDAIAEDTVFPEGSLNARYARDEVIERVRTASAYDFLRNGHIQTRAQVAMRWVLNNPHISTVLTGASTPDQLQDCAVASDAPPFSNAAMAQADSLHSKNFEAA